MLPELKLIPSRLKIKAKAERFRSSQWTGCRFATIASKAAQRPETSRNILLQVIEQQRVTC
jgi:hypothetical protein